MGGATDAGGTGRTSIGGQRDGADRSKASRSFIQNLAKNTVA